MWWTNKNGRIEGPFPEDEIRARIRLNILNSLDRVSDDQVAWRYLKDTVLWKPTQTISSTTPPGRGHPRASKLGAGGKTPVQTPISTSSSASRQVHMPMPPRPRMTDWEAVDREKRQRTYLIGGIAAGVVLLGVVLLITAVGVVMGSGKSKKGASSSIAGSEVEEPSAPSATPNSTKSDFNAVKDKLAIIECKEGSGSGFLLDMDGKTYLVSNEHVLRSAFAPRVKMIDGSVLKLGAFSVATDRDIARFEVLDCKVEPFELSDVTPNTSDEVALYGNSLGEGVATESKGFIQGVGPTRIESNVEIVHGNSGSPLVGKDGKVLGVAAFMVNSGNGKQDWTIRNTRYDGNPRRFAVRFTNIQWKTVDRRDYETQVARLNEVGLIWEYMLPYLLAEKCKFKPEDFVFNDLNAKDFKGASLGFDEVIRELSEINKKRETRYLKWNDHVKARQVFIDRLVENKVDKETGEKAVAEYDDKSKEYFDRLKESSRDYTLKRKEALMRLRQALSETRWEAPQLLNGYPPDDTGNCVARYQAIVGNATDLMNQQLKDLDKAIRSIEKMYNGEADDDE